MSARDLTAVRGDFRLVEEEIARLRKERELLIELFLFSWEFGKLEGEGLTQLPLSEDEDVYRFRVFLNSLRKDEES